MVILQRSLKDTFEVMPQESIALYFHIPYCSFMCHYCDFAKTARFDTQGFQIFFQKLQAHTKEWLALAQQRLPEVSSPYKSVYFGGGTPSLATIEYQPLLDLLRGKVHPASEITLEANPSDITKDSLERWKSMGFNRLSLGVQSFSPKGLKFLTRQHTPEIALESIRSAQEIFDHINIDLIYGWSEQSFEEWLEDLKTLAEIKPRHLSLYQLTYASGTPIGRAHNRGRLKPMPDRLITRMYTWACKFLSDLGYEHEEVSNWHLPGYDAIHNQHYWQMGHYLGIGPGAHGFMPSSDQIGLRYCYPSHVQRFLGHDLEAIGLQETMVSWLQRNHLELEVRDKKSWLLEVIANGLRSKFGINLKQIEQTVNARLVPKGNVAKALDKRILTIKDDYLTLTTSEWIRENAWVLELFSSFEYP